jgi:DNA polymerase I
MAVERKANSRMTPVVSATPTISCMPRTVLLLDGNSLSYRAFYALPSDMATASGQVTNAVFGFTSMVQYLLNEHKPDLLVCTFDRSEPTFRHAQIKDYKAGRVETPDILRQQLGLIRQVVESLGIPMFESVGFEADDVIATLATQLMATGDAVIIVTGDRDSYQLVHDATPETPGSIRVLYNKRGVSDYSLYDEAGIVGKTGVTPEKYAIYAALRGDPSDNLPGVPGVGEKTAAKLINDYGDLDGVFANIHKATPKLRENLAAAEVQVRSNATATPLVRDVPGIDATTIVPPAPDLPRCRELFKSLEFKALTDRVLTAFHECFGIGGAPTPVAAPTERVNITAVEIGSIADAVTLLTRLRSLADVSIAGDWPGAEGRSLLNGIAITDGKDAWWIGADLLRAHEVHAALGALLGHDVGHVAGTAAVHGHRVKELVRSLHDLGLPLGSLDAIGVDTAIAAYLLDPADNLYALEELAARYANLDLRAEDAPPEGQLDFGGNTEPAGDRAAKRAIAVSKLVDPIREAMRARALFDLYDQIERPLIGSLTRMEAVGVRVDSSYLKQLNDDLTSEAARAEAEVWEAAGEKFLVNSVPQLRTVLFDKLGLKTDKKTKTGYSTDAQSLEKLRGEHPIIEPLLRYREMEKLRSTYGEGLIAEVASDGRIHATFNQTVARTGRLSSDQPNLHNIPVRSEEGKRFRRAFIPAEGTEFLVADYNQIELRVIAHLAQDPGLIEAFTTGADIHNATASRVFDVAPEEVTTAQRSRAKMVSYGLAYGMESFGLAQRLNIDTKEAQTILDAYFEAFPNVRSYMDRAVADARNKGYTETLFGRRRQIPELQSPNFRIRQMGERQAMNAGIQGLAADIFKVALVRLDDSLLAAGHRSRIILQVHDEVVVEVFPEERDAVKTLTIDTMGSACLLDVPLVVNVSWGNNWGEAKG